MKIRTIIGTIFVVASLLKLACYWNIIHWTWFENIPDEPWAKYLAPVLLIWIGVNFIIDDRRNKHSK